jgi:hypothetical protein
MPTAPAATPATGEMAPIARAVPPIPSAWVRNDWPPTAWPTWAPIAAPPSAPARPFSIDLPSVWPVAAKVADSSCIGRRLRVDSARKV